MSPPDIYPSSEMLTEICLSALKGYEILTSRMAWKTTGSYAAYNGPQGQDSVYVSNANAPSTSMMMGTQLPTGGVDFNFDELADWLCPTTDEIPWASLDDFPTDFQV